MVDTTGQDLFDIGSQQGCNHLGSESVYSILNLYMNTVPSILKMGACVPKACSQEALTRTMNLLTNLIQPMCKDFFNDAIIYPEKQLDE